jgi:hypothetical protein
LCAYVAGSDQAEKSPSEQATQAIFLQNSKHFQAFKFNASELSWRGMHECRALLRIFAVQKVVFELDGVDEIFGSSRASVPAVDGIFVTELDLQLNTTHNRIDDLNGNANRGWPFELKQDDIR